MAASWHGHQTFLTATHKNQSTLSRYTTCERLTEGQMDTEIDNQQLWLKTETYRSKKPEETSANILLVPNYCTIRVLWLHLLKTKLLNDKVLIQESGNVICPSLHQLSSSQLWVFSMSIDIKFVYVTFNDSSWGIWILFYWLSLIHYYHNNW